MDVLFPKPPAEWLARGISLDDAMVYFARSWPQACQFMDLRAREIAMRMTPSLGSEPLSQVEQADLRRCDFELRRDLAMRLGDGRLRASGFRFGQPTREQIDPLWWRGARMDYDANSATNHGVTFSGIVVREAEAPPLTASTHPPDQQPERVAASPPITRHPEAVKRGPPVKHNWVPLQHEVSRRLALDGVESTGRELRAQLLRWALENIETHPDEKTISRKLDELADWTAF